MTITTATATTATTRERLEDGASPTTPPGDNLLADFLAVESAAYRALALAAGGRAAVDDELGLSMGDSASVCYFGNVAYATRPMDSAAAAAEAVRRVRRFYGEGAGGPFLLFTPWALGNLRDAGFDLAGHPPLMIRPPRAIEPRRIDGADVSPASSSGEVADFDRTLSEAYPADALLPYGTQRPLFDDRAVAAGWQLFTARLADEPVATAAAYASEQIVAIEAVSTRPQLRGRRLGELVTAAAVASAPDVPAALLSSDDGRPVYSRLGFLPVMRFTLWVGSR